MSSTVYVLHTLITFLRANHPHAIVYNQSVNACLQHAIDTYQSRKPAPLHSLNSKMSTALPPMPKPGEVDIIYGGKLSSDHD